MYSSRSHKIVVIHCRNENHCTKSFAFSVPFYFYFNLWWACIIQLYKHSLLWCKSFLHFRNSMFYFSLRFFVFFHPTLFQFLCNNMMLRMNLQKKHVSNAFVCQCNDIVCPSNHNECGGKTLKTFPIETICHIVLNARKVSWN